MAALRGGHPLAKHNGGAMNGNLLYRVLDFVAGHLGRRMRLRDGHVVAPDANVP